MKWSVTQDMPPRGLEISSLIPGSRFLQGAEDVTDGFNDWHTRRAAMRKLGAQFVEHGWHVVALRFASEAWTRSFTDEEDRARGDRSIETYDDKQEELIVHGQTLDGRLAFARAALLRDKVGRIRAVRPWHVEHYSTTNDPRITSQILDAAWNGYLRTMAERRGWTQSDPHC